MNPNQSKSRAQSTTTTTTAAAAAAAAGSTSNFVAEWSSSSTESGLEQQQQQQQYGAINNNNNINTNTADNNPGGAAVNVFPDDTKLVSMFTDLNSIAMRDKRLELPPITAEVLSIRILIDNINQRLSIHSNNRANIELENLQLKAQLYQSQIELIQLQQLQRNNIESVDQELHTITILTNQLKLAKKQLKLLVQNAIQAEQENNKAAELFTAVFHSITPESIELATVNQELIESQNLQRQNQINQQFTAEQQLSIELDNELAAVDNEWEIIQTDRLINQKLVVESEEQLKLIESNKSVLETNIQQSTALYNRIYNELRAEYHSKQNELRDKQARDLFNQQRLVEARELIRLQQQQDREQAEYNRQLQLQQQQSVTNSNYAGRSLPEPIENRSSTMRTAATVTAAAPDIDSDSDFEPAAQSRSRSNRQNRTASTATAAASLLDDSPTEFTVPPVSDSDFKSPINLVQESPTATATATAMPAAESESIIQQQLQQPQQYNYQYQYNQQQQQYQSQYPNTNANPNINQYLYQQQQQQQQLYLHQQQQDPNDKFIEF